MTTTIDTSQELAIILERQDVAPDSAKILLDAFGAPFDAAGVILREYKTIEVTSESDTATMKLAREKRLALKKVRTTVENKRKQLKEDIVRNGRAIDSVARFVKEVITPAEDYLQLQEDYAKIKQAEREAAIKQQRLERLSGFKGVDLSIYNLDGMSDDCFDELIAELKVEQEHRIEAERVAAAEAQAKAEAERLEQERIRKDNERLRAEREQAEAEAARQRAIADEERRKREQLEQEELARQNAEKRAEREAMLAPDKDKLVTFADALAIIQTQKLPVVKSSPARRVVTHIAEQLQALEHDVRNSADRLDA